MKGREQHTSVNFSSENHAYASYSGLNDRTVLGIVVDDLMFPALDFIAGDIVPHVWYY